MHLNGRRKILIEMNRELNEKMTGSLTNTQRIDADHKIKVSLYAQINQQLCLRLATLMSGFVWGVSMRRVKKL